MSVWTVASAFFASFASAASRDSLSNAALRSSLSTTRIALATSFWKFLRTHLSSVASVLSSGYSRFFLPAFFASWSIALTIFLISSCANATASRNTSSVISLAPPSTIITASSVPATTISMPPVSYCSSVGLVTNSPFSSRPTRTAATFLSNGMSLTASAAPAAQTAMTSLSRPGSVERTVAMIWMSLRKPSGNRGRMGRSICRALSTPCSDGRPSRLM